MASLYDLLVSPDAETEAAALQDALRKRAARGAVLTALGGRRGDPLGQQMMQSAEQGQAGMVNVAGQRLRNAMQQQQIKHQMTKSGTPYYSALPSGEGYLSFDARTGRASPLVVDGRRAVPAAVDPDLQARLAAERAKAKASGEAAGKAGVELPRAEAQAEETLRLTEELLRHPGLKQAVGTSSLLGIQKIPGTDARDFMIRLDQLRGKQFLEAFQGLKGGGQITEAEGKKATEAIARMDAAGSEAGFVSAVRDFQSVINAGLKRARNAATAGSDGRPAPTAGAPRRRRFNPATGQLE